MRWFKVLIMCAPLLVGRAALAQVGPFTQADLPFIEVVDCPFDLPGDIVEARDIDCGYLVTWENYADSSSEAIEIAFAIIYAYDNIARTDPIFYLEGGPGGSALYGIEDWYNHPLMQQRDIVLIDQRGTGFSYPSLNCFEVEEAESEDSLDAAEACYERLVDEGINLQFYNSAQSALDVSTLFSLLQTDLGYSEYNLLGVSYGTRLALTVMRDASAGVRSAVLDAVYPPNVNAYEEQGINFMRALRTLFDGCALNTACNNAYPNLEAILFDTIDALNADPLVYVTEDADTGEEVEELVDGDLLLDILFESLYDTNLIPLLPMVIGELARGDVTVLDELYPEADNGGFRRRPRQSDEEDFSDSEGLFNSVECHEEVPFNSLDAVRAAGVSLPPVLRDKTEAEVENIFQTCRIWNVGRPRAIENEPVVSGIPTLLLAGEYDPITPPVWAQLAAESLSNSYVHIFPGLGHGALDVDCPVSIILQFLDNPYARPDASCVAGMGGPAFVTP